MSRPSCSSALTRRRESVNAAAEADSSRDANAERLWVRARDLLDQMHAIAEKARYHQDAKVRFLVEWIRKKQCSDHSFKKASTTRSGQEKVKRGQAGQNWGPLRPGAEAVFWVPGVEKKEAGWRSRKLPKSIIL